MFHIRQYWEMIRNVEATIADDEPWLISLEDTLRGFVGGRVCQTSKEAAAKAIVKGSHRLATADEVAAHRESEQQQKATAANDHRRKMGAELGVNLGVGVFVLPSLKEKGRK